MLGWGGILLVGVGGKETHGARLCEPSTTNSKLFRIEADQIFQKPEEKCLDIGPEITEGKSSLANEPRSSRDVLTRLPHLPRSHVRRERSPIQPERSSTKLTEKSQHIQNSHQISITA